ncbi:hypothetical protein K7432_012843 [Basidiobolus ranarum]|uniref:RFX-type winged-helix domain-containing protein n=1 Tax=Basidiobolus ranarum TaxID=34480 RepID=A0ABR2VRM0_9FUNG
MDGEHSLVTDSLDFQSPSDTTFSTTLPPILSSLGQSKPTIPSFLPPPSTLSGISSNSISTTFGGTSNLPPLRDPLPKSGEEANQASVIYKTQPDIEGSEPESESHSKQHSGVDLSILNTDELRRLALESRENLEYLSTKTHEPSPGSADKARSIWISTWLVDNYEPADDQSVSREALYSRYTTFCDKTRVQHVNSASFGKIVRSVFPNITTRRLGTRGQSKYPFFEKYSQVTISNAYSVNKT